VQIIASSQNDEHYGPLYLFIAPDCGVTTDLPIKKDVHGNNLGPLHGGGPEFSNGQQNATGVTYIVWDGVTSLTEMPHSGETAGGAKWYGFHVMGGNPKLFLGYGCDTNHCTGTTNSPLVNQHNHSVNICDEINTASQSSGCLWYNTGYLTAANPECGHPDSPACCGTTTDPGSCALIGMSGTNNITVTNPDGLGYKSRFSSVEVDWSSDGFPNGDAGDLTVINFYAGVSINAYMWGLDGSDWKLAATKKWPYGPRFMMNQMYDFVGKPTADNNLYVQDDQTSKPLRVNTLQNWVAELENPISITGYQPNMAFPNEYMEQLYSLYPSDATGDDANAIKLGHPCASRALSGEHEPAMLNDPTSPASFQGSGTIQRNGTAPNYTYSIIMEMSLANDDWMTNLPPPPAPGGAAIPPVNLIGTNSNQLYAVRATLDADQVACGVLSGAPASCKVHWEYKKTHSDSWEAWTTYPAYQGDGFLGVSKEIFQQATAPMAFGYFGSHRLVKWYQDSDPTSNGYWVDATSSDPHTYLIKDLYSEQMMWSKNIFDFKDEAGVSKDFYDPSTQKVFEIQTSKSTPNSNDNITGYFHPYTDSYKYGNMQFLTRPSHNPEGNKLVLSIAELTCTADFNNDGQVTIEDVLMSLDYWGRHHTDLTGDMTTDVDDLLVCLGMFGECNPVGDTSPN
jgi:hypothetical protein